MNVNQTIYYPRLLKRVQAVLIDSVVTPVGILGTIYFGSLLDVTDTWIKAVLFIAPIMILEPGLVSWTGGTIGHHVVKIRVRNQNSDSNLNIVLAMARFIVKLLFGWFSLIFVLTTRRHQAIHDIVARSIVVHKDAIMLPSHEALTERASEEQGYVYPAKWERLIVVLAYLVLMTISLAALAIILQSDSCVDTGNCDGFEQFIEKAMSFLWLILAGTIIVFGWAGRLYGCRRRPLIGEKTPE